MQGLTQQAEGPLPRLLQGMMMMICVLRGSLGGYAVFTPRFRAAQDAFYWAFQLVLSNGCSKRGKAEAMQCEGVLAARQQEVHALLVCPVHLVLDGGHTDAVHLLLKAFYKYL